MNIFPPSDQQHLDDSHAWVGGEGTVGSQAERHHVRRQERNTGGLAMTILGLTFVGGFALAGALCQLSRRAG
jgi:hypothetical protein